MKIKKALNNVLFLKIIYFIEEGHYYTYYENIFGTKSIAYEASTIKIILKDNKSDESDKSDKPDNSSKIQVIGIIVGSVVGGLVLIGIIIFIVVKYCKRKKDTIDDISGNDEDFLGIN